MERRILRKASDSNWYKRNEAACYLKWIELREMGAPGEFIDKELKTLLNKRKQMEEVKAVLIRLQENDKQTLGVFKAFKGLKNIFGCKILELADKDNQKFISRIPEGIYRVVKHDSPTFGKCFWVKDVPGRDEVLIHWGNYYRNTKGCLLAGRDFLDIDKDNYTDVTNSKRTMTNMLHKMPDEFYLQII